MHSTRSNRLTYHSDTSNAKEIPAATMVPPIRLPDMETNNPAQNAQPTYPAGMINIRHPPRYFVTPPGGWMAGTLKMRQR